ncbi:multicopper oxidase family protein [Virgibacillus salexigens]|uniref:multicopper oxidase family protein n=1 Tax=Virgibacillus salexigens TaxID=61016 RepID=UPI00190A9FC1|nr:multicopper oxidase domain-containing protein [Virgibacillus salexigens]
MKLKKFIDELPIMQTIKKQGSYLEMRMEEFRQKLHRDLKPTRLWGYNNQFPGPTIEVNEGEELHIKWENHLPDNHLLPVDKSIHHIANHPEVRTVTHVHGSVTKPENDGYPEAWFSRNFKKVGPEFLHQVYSYPNKQRAATLWYHDHAMGITRLNVYAGLAGMYIIRGKQEKRLNIPKDEYEIPLILMDKTINNDGSLFYPVGPENPPANLPIPSILPAFTGDKILVNGKIWPYLNVEPRKYRFRILNASNTRTYTISLESGDPMYQIGSDGGLLSKTVVARSITMEPAERIDVIIDFRKYQGKSLILRNDLGSINTPEDETGDIMQFNVRLPLKGKDSTIIPKHLSSIPSLKDKPISAIRNLKLVGASDDFGRPLLLLDNKYWDDPISETPKLGSTEIWSIINVTGFTHPIHLHLVQFQVLDRTPFNLEKFNQDGSIVYTGSAVKPKPNERGWKDTIAAPSAQITRLIATFSPYAGKFVWHCHILEHEDYDMMRPFLIQKRD